MKANRRSIGIGYQLIEKLYSRAKENNYRAIFAETQTTNTAAIKFYRRCGFELDGMDISLYSNKDIKAREVAIFFRKKIVD